MLGANYFGFPYFGQGPGHVIAEFNGEIVLIDVAGQDRMVAVLAYSRVVDVLAPRHVAVAFESRTLDVEAKPDIIVPDDREAEV